MKLNEWLAADRASELIFWVEDSEAFVKRKLSLAELLEFLAEVLKERRKTEKPKSSTMSKTSLLNREITEKQAFQ